MLIWLESLKSLHKTSTSESWVKLCELRLNWNVFFRKIPGLKSVFRTRGRNGRMIQVRRDPPVQSRPPLRSDHVAQSWGLENSPGMEGDCTASLCNLLHAWLHSRWSRLFLLLVWTSHLSLCLLSLVLPPCPTSRDLAPFTCWRPHGYR